MEKGKAREQPNHEVITNKTNNKRCDMEKGKAEEQPNHVIKQTRNNNRCNKEKGKAEEQPNLEDRDTISIKDNRW